MRETGAIPAVLMVTIASLGIGDIRGLVPIGMWVILLTLIIEPILTPWVAKKLRVAEPISDDKKIELGSIPCVILATRGHSFLPRLDLAANWASKHNIEQMTILLCLEDRYSPELLKQIKEDAENTIRNINTNLKDEQLPELTLNFIARKGMLQDNVQQLSQIDHGVVAVFVGRKVLDFRLNDIKNLGVPLYFLP